MSESLSPAGSPALQAASLAGAGDWAGAVEVLTNLGSADLTEAVGELAGMAIARDAVVFPRTGDCDELAPDWTSFWPDWAMEAVRTGNQAMLARVVCANPAGSEIEAACLGLLLDAAVGTGEVAA